jgi:CHAT domain-containing protein
MRLPLHAAGIYTGNDRECCSDYLVASYTPSIGALLHAQQTVQPIRKLEADTLLVAVRHPFQDVALPMVEEEAEVVQQHVSPSSKVIRASNCPDMLKHIQSASIVHLACHGTQNPSDALQSGFYLEDGLLSVSKLMDLDLPRAFLAVLSACETAKGDAAQPDQAIHLAAAMLFAGFKSVIATMWYIIRSRAFATGPCSCPAIGSWGISKDPSSPRASTLRYSTTIMHPSASTQTTYHTP